MKRKKPKSQDPLHAAAELRNQIDSILVGRRTSVVRLVLLEFFYLTFVSAGGSYELALEALAKIHRMHTGAQRMLLPWHKRWFGWLFRSRKSAPVLVPAPAPNGMTAESIDEFGKAIRGAGVQL